ncbi:MAG: TetR/AcrR family transcriptional regulator [Candidatus Cloacimonetes bacterium]|nr:TetR/AcrR family transcriptional regulator [Candidatus Cloacimonadota bacterium]
MQRNLRGLKTKQIAKRRAILEAAIESFAQKGFHNTRIADVAQQAQVADGTVYLYFQNKDELLIKAFEEMFDANLQRIRDEVDKQETGIDRLNRFFELHVELFTENPRIAQFMAVELRQSPEFYNKYPEYSPFKSYMSYMRQLCDQAVNEGEVRPINTEALIMIIFGTIDFVLTEWSVKGRVFSLGIIKNDIMDIIRFGTRPRD